MQALIEPSAASHGRYPRGTYGEVGGHSGTGLWSPLTKGSNRDMRCAASGDRRAIRAAVAVARRKQRWARGIRAVIAIGAVFGLTGTHALPAMAQTYSEDSAAVGTYSAQEVQRLRVAAGIEAADIRRDAGVQGSADIWSVPLRGELRDAYGPRLQRPVAGVSSFHRGQDLGASCGTPVRSAAAGRVVQAGWNGSYGGWVLVDHGGGVQTGYAHNARALVSVGQSVQAGEVIAAVGSTGASSGCHVHFETRVAGTAVDPVAFMQARDAPLH